jgi:hypothetical protein
MMITSRLPRLMSPKRTEPSTSVMTAGSLGARLEELRDPRQTAGDVARLVRLARDLGQRGARLDLLAVAHRELRADRDDELAELLTSFSSRISIIGWSFFARSSMMTS